MLGSLISGITGAVSATGQLIEAQKTREMQEKYNEQSLALARESFDAQLKQQEFSNAQYLDDKKYAREQDAWEREEYLSNQAWEREQYLNNQDYQKALQQTIFDREDTALQRALEDVTSAGFSPLAALGNAANAGSIVSMSSAPGSSAPDSSSVGSPSGSGPSASFSASASTALQDAFNHFASVGSQVGAMVATYAEGNKQREFQRQAQITDLSAKAKQAGLDRLAAYYENNAQREFLKNENNLQRMHDVQMNVSSQEAQKKLVKLQAELQSYSREDEQQHQLDMLEKQQNFTQSQNNNSGGRGIHDVINDIINVASNGDGHLAKWLRKNPEGLQVLGLVVEGIEIVVNGKSSSSSPINK